MSLLLLLTGSAGFLTSYVLLLCGVGRMWVRYPVAILAAYGVFLLLLRAWLAAQGRRNSHPDVDPLNLSSELGGFPAGGGTGGATPDFSFGGGGDFAGGGAGGDWTQVGGAGAADLGSTPGGADHGLLSPGGGPVPAGGVSSGGSSGGGLLDSLDFDLDLDLDGEGCAVLLALVALAAALVVGLVVSLYVVWAAPALLAEILVDGLLVAGLYKRMKGVERRHWLRAAVRKTWLPVAVTLVSFAAAGYLMQRAAPRARSVGEFWRSITSD